MEAWKIIFFLSFYGLWALLTRRLVLSIQMFNQGEVEIRLAESHLHVINCKNGPESLRKPARSSQMCNEQKLIRRNFPQVQSYDGRCLIAQRTSWYINMGSCSVPVLKITTASSVFNKQCVCPHKKAEIYSPICVSLHFCGTATVPPMSKTLHARSVVTVKTADFSPGL